MLVVMYMKKGELRPYDRIKTRRHEKELKQRMAWVRLGCTIITSDKGNSNHEEMLEWTTLNWRNTITMTDRLPRGTPTLMGHIPSSTPNVLEADQLGHSVLRGTYKGKTSDQLFKRKHATYRTPVNKMFLKTVMLQSKPTAWNTVLQRLTAVIRLFKKKSLLVTKRSRQYENSKQD